MPRLRIASLLLACFSLSASTQADDIPTVPGEPPAALVDYGRQIFEFNFARPDKLARNVKLGPGGNGLGPLFNDASCAGCHRQGGMGGGGGLDSNVLMLGIVVRPLPKATIEEVLAISRKVHPGFSDTTPVKIIQKSAIGDPTDAERYDQWRDELLRTFQPKNPGDVMPVHKKFGPVTLELAQRNTPALWGMGLIDRFIKQGGNEIRRRVAKEQNEKHSWISGRPPITPDGQEGWYGWRGQIATLESMVGSACATEVGLQLPGFKETEFFTSQGDKRKKRTEGVDLTLDQFNSLVAFVQSIPKPESVSASSVEEDRVQSGEKVFARIGCADCHVKDLGWVRGIFSDMLLHDMGDYDEDVQVTAPPQPITKTVVTATQSYASFSTLAPGGYGATMALTTSFLPTTIFSETTLYEEQPAEQEQEWKTPPLWGVADSAPYYHDGRAASLKDAIEVHAGEARRAAGAFRELSSEDQELLLGFLKSLKAPRTNSPDQPGSVLSEK